MRKIPWDFLCSLLIAIGVYLSLPYHNPGSFLKEIYQTATIVLAILLASVYAGIIFNNIANKTEKQLFLKPLGFSLKISFAALLYSTTFYFFTSFCTQAYPGYDQNKTWVVIGCLLTLNALFTALKTGLAILKNEV